MGRLFWKFFLSILLAQIATAVGVGTVFWLRDQARMQASAKAHAAVDTGPSAEFMIDSAAATLRHGGVNALRDLVTSTTRQPLYVVDDNGREMLGRLVSPELHAQAARLLAGAGRYDAVRKLTAPDGRHYLVFVRSMGRPDMSRPARGGPGGPPSRPFIPYATIIGGTAASFLFAGLLAWYFSRPIRALRSAFEAAAAGDLSPRFAPVKGVRGDELNALGRDFDRMSGQLRTLMEGQRRLLHDVSHELRSPLARLQAAIGLAHQQPGKIAASLERIEREGVRMDKLVGELLTLSRLEASAALPQDEDIAFMDLMDDIVADARFEAEQSGRMVEVRGAALVTLRGAPDLLWRALENVIRNAIKHSPEGGCVELEIDAHADQVRLQVLDRGPGVAEQDLHAIFEPFYRSNATSNNVDGHGLGLAIAQRVIGAHGGAIVASNRTGGGLCVAITLPVTR